MCGRFYIETDDLGTDILELLNDMPKHIAFKSSGEIVPGDTVPAITRNRNGSIIAYPMTWGFKIGNSAKLVINARSETASEKPLFRDSWYDRRCLLPFTAYYEWDRSKAKYAFWPDDRQICCLAGLYRPDGAGRFRFAVLTRQAVQRVQEIHDRMPIIFSYEQGCAWMKDRSDSAQTSAYENIHYEAVKAS